MPLVVFKVFMPQTCSSLIVPCISEWSNHPLCCLSRNLGVTLTLPFSSTAYQFARCCWFYFLSLFHLHPCISLCIANSLGQAVLIFCPVSMVYYFIALYLVLPPNCHHCLPRTLVVLTSYYKELNMQKIRQNNKIKNMYPILTLICVWYPNIIS